MNTGSEAIDRMKHSFMKTDGTYEFPNSLEGDILKIAKKEINEFLEENKRKNIFNVLHDAGYIVSIVNTAWYTKTSPPIWCHLYRGELSEREYKLVDTMVQKILDEEGLTAPNGYHAMSGNLRMLYGQDNIDRQVKEIHDSGRPCGLIWHLELQYRRDF